MDTSGRIGARVWNDVDLLDGRFAAGDAVRVLGRVERFRDKLQVEVRTLEPAEGVDPAGLTPGLRRDADELDGFLEFLVGEVHDDALRGVVTRALAEAPLREYPATPDGHHSYAGGLLEHTVGVATLCRELAQIHPRLRADLLLAAALVHDVGRTRELGRPPVFAPTEEGRLLGHVHLGLRMLEELGRARRAAARGRLPPRRPRRPHRRGGRSLPREPARRRRRDAAGAGLALAALLALAASLSWGVGDFLGGVKARVLPSLTVLAASQPFGLAALGHRRRSPGNGDSRRRGGLGGARGAVRHRRSLRVLPRHGGRSDQRRGADRGRRGRRSR